MRPDFSLTRFLKAEEAASSVEYGFLIAGIALAIFASVIFLGQVIMDRFYGPAQLLFS
ncbi:MAG: Flp family type IVb pilin [Syntrophobacterales bacterium]|nr:Flp family type IVb pilin [Syntrophobacterales bacterium]